MLRPSSAARKLIAAPTTGTFSERITHYSVLRTIEDAYGLACVANSCTASPITDIWNLPGWTA